MTHWILAVNPGSTSTKLALFEDDSLYAAEALRHNPRDLAPEIVDQLEYRTDLAEKWLNSVFVGDKLSAIVGRGGMLKPIPGGTYMVNEAMRQDLRKGVQGQHASNLGGLIAFELASKRGIPAFIVDPVSVDEMIPEARISGMPEIQRHSSSHALNIRAIARRAAKDLGQDLRDINLILVHLGGGISVTPMAGGRMLDVNDANEMGPFSPERSGGLPSGDLIDLCFSGKYIEDELRRKIVRSSGLSAYLGTNDGLEIERRISAGDQKAQLIYKAMAYQIAKEIGAMATVLSGQVRAIAITGGLAYSTMLTDWIKDDVRFIAPVLVYPGEDELLALAQGCLRVIKGEEQSREYV
ncbi:MAG: butyrate kinase [Eubacteriales bacterium]|nr:butyrate kinase [Eubacteriales bacterium]MDD3072958.1 butyrate kinase [Eubacteriales bacterium]MDD4078496.1 butyrate kinase [Eubacteriales bacterium]MDD4768372.1 butyrate kinase [Eubacteriales bacterium]